MNKQNQLIQSNLKIKMFKCFISTKTLQKYFFTKVAVVTSSAVLGFTVLQTSLVQAATITYDFTVNINVGPLSSSVGRGFLSYDNSLPLVDNIYNSPVSLRTVASLFFDFDGKTFSLTDSDRIGSNRAPVVFGDDPGSIYFGLYNFFVSGSVVASPEEQFVTTNTKVFGIQYDDFYYDVEEAAGVPDFACYECITYTLREASILSVPEPNALGGLFLLSIGVVLKKKAKLRKASSVLSKVFSN
jgi:hypothetical protein